MDLLNGSVLGGSLITFKQLTKKPEKFLGVQREVRWELKLLLKNLYDYTKRSESSSSSILTHGNTLPALIIKHFDEEQIWQELELQNDAKCNKFISDVSQLIAGKDNLKIGVSVEGDDVICRNERKKTANVEFERTEESEVSADGNISDGQLDDEAEEEVEEIEEEDLQQDKRHDLKNKGKGKTKSSIVDDQFFKLKDLENYLNSEDRKESQHIKKGAINSRQEDDDVDDESIDYFEDIQSGEEEEEGEGVGAEAYYKDFFDPPDAEDSKIETDLKEEESEFGNDEHEEGEEEHDEKKVRFNLSPTSSESDRSESEDDKEQTINKSSFEARQERLKARIEKLEDEAIADKPWQLKGEISASSRPQNSLLEEILEFDLTTRPAPVVTEQTTMKLEDIIRQRIKDKAWDDVERKIKPVKAPDEYKKQLVMDQEKSKLSLAEVYEQEFIKQREAQDPTNHEKPEEEPKENQEVRAMMSDLFVKLDALSNFHYTPKPVVPEIKVISNLPAISMEEVAPVAASDATLLAPEEVKAKPKGDVIGKAERTKTDKKRERRHKKAIQRQRHRERENRAKIVQKLKPGLGNKYSKERALQMLEKVSKEKNVEQMADMGKDKGVRSSTAFFARLQEEVTSHIKAHTDPVKRKMMKNNISAKKIKL